MNNAKQPMINDALRILRLYLGLSQKEVSDKVGISQSMISEIERGSKSVSLEVLSKYSDKFNVRMSDLMFFAEELENEPVKTKGKLFIASKILSILERLAPREIIDA